MVRWRYEIRETTREDDNPQFSISRPVHCIGGVIVLEHNEKKTLFYPLPGALRPRAPRSLFGPYVCPPLEVEILPGMPTSLHNR